MCKHDIDSLLLLYIFILYTLFMFSYPSKNKSAVK
jgi:Ca2+/Na+ antiporter